MPRTIDVYDALASPVRREILALLLQGPCKVNDIARNFAIARPSVSEHLQVLRTVGLVDNVTAGRERLYSLNAEPLREVRDWVTLCERFWLQSASGIEDILDREAQRSGRDS